MYIAVKCYRLGSIWGIFFGVPLFIFAGFQHSIANVITAGVALQLSPTILLCAAGNFCGSVITAWLADE
jgi:formate/nitrite transporter FocA (FNT family)